MTALLCLNAYSLGFFCQTKVHGKDRVKFMESLVVADIAELKDNQVGLRNVSCSR